MAKQHLPVYNICTLANEPIAQHDFMVDYFDHYLAAHTDLHFPHKHSFYHLVYFTKGAGTHSIDFKTFPVIKGQIYFMVPGQVHTWEFNGITEGFIINFSAHFIHTFITNPRYLEQFNFFSGNINEQVIDIKKEHQKEMVQLFETIINEHRSLNEFKEDMVRIAMVQLFIQISRCSNKKPLSDAKKYNSIVFKNFQKLIDQNYKIKKLPKDYAVLLYITPNHLNALCNDIAGNSAGELIRNRILLEAKRLLINVGISISEIAIELNFIDNSYFTKFFKRYTGTTPELFRNQFNNKNQ